MPPIVSIQMFDWPSIKDAFQHLIMHPGVRQVKGDNWTVYRTASCIRIDFTINEEEPAHA